MKCGDTLFERNRFFVEGVWAKSSGTDEVVVINPATERLLAVVRSCSGADIDWAVGAAARALPNWSATPVCQRVGLFMKLALLLKTHAAELTRTMVNEFGYPKRVAEMSHLAGSIRELESIADSLGMVRWIEYHADATVQHLPTGVVGVVAGWNAPLRSIISKVGAAIAAGCTVVLKPSQLAPLSAFMFAELCLEAGMPDGVFNLVTGPGTEVSNLFLAHSQIDTVSLIGSVKTGRRMTELVSSTDKPVHFEWGGKSASIILADADLEFAVVTGIEDALRHSGQVCGAPARLLIHRDQMKRAEELAVQAAQGYVMGDPFDPATTLGPLSTLVARDRVRAYIRSGLGEGARMLTGGADAPSHTDRGYYVKPTIFTTGNASRIAHEEIFGPVVVLIPYDDERQAVEFANAPQSGPTASVWCGDSGRARSLARNLRVRRVRINGAPLDRRGEHGVFKPAGVGRDWGRSGVEEFLHHQAVIG